ncbi:MAG: TIGR02452 family protein [Blautia sp.]|nr:TIGR02452 family protein [Blautia sp.]
MSMKEQRAEQARNHTKKMQESFGDGIAESVRNTTVYDTDFVSQNHNVCDTDFVVEPLDSVSAVMKYADGQERMAVLNFASYKNPGGGFINGSRAQEECLCHESFLYNVLSQFQDTFYEWNIRNRNHSLYLNRGLYSPGVIFSRDGRCVPCDVITCAAPNKSAAGKYRNVSGGENTKALRSRIRFVLDIAGENRVDILILGAFGCGVFGQDAGEVAGIFREYLQTTHRCFKRVIFAVPEGKDGNLKAFYDKF